MYEKLVALAERLDQVRDQIQTEEATKTALILPFIRELGYDVFNPAEVVPEFIADVGIKKGEKVDYAICHEGKPIILMECKPIGARLDTYSSQLYRYFSVTSARIAILTDGVEYRFFTDLAEPNKLDRDPFFTFTLERLRKDDALRVEQFNKAHFDLDQVLAHAESLHYRTAIRSHFAREMNEPSDALVRLFAEPIHHGRMTANVVEKFRFLVKSAIADFISDSVERRLQAALRGSAPVAADAPVTAPPEQVAELADDTDEAEREQEIVTTMEELHGFYIVKAILHDLVDPKRITARDVRSYFGVLLDDNNRKPICRLWLNRSKKYLGLFDDTKRETRMPIEDVEDLFKYTGQIRESLTHLLDHSAAESE